MSLSNHPGVLQVVNGKTFVQSVRLSCEILKDSTSLTDDVIRRAALTQAYPRIALILASTTDKDGKGIIAQGSISYEILYREVERLATSQPYVDDIHRVAAALTASYFIKATPLNSSIQLLPLGDRMEQQAIEDLDRLRGQVLHQIKSLLGSGDSVANGVHVTDPTFYFSGLIEDGRSSDQILIPIGTKGVAVYTLTTHQPVPLEIAIEVPTNLPSLITKLSEGINQLSIRGGSNILASPNRGAYVVVGTDRIAGGAIVRLDYITLSPRRSDYTVTKELVILCFYLIPEDVPIDNWRGNTLETSIPSLLYGVVPSYEQLHPSGPHSILLQVEKGTVTKVNTIDTVDTMYLHGQGDGVVKYSISIDGVPHDGIVPVSSSSSLVEQVVGALREVLGTKALVAQVNPQAIQVVPSAGTSTLSVGLTSVPSGVTTSVGTSTTALYPYGYGPVAVTINPNGNGRSIRRPTKAEEATGVYSAVTFSMQVSPRMQSVYDQMGRMDRLRRGQGGCC